MNNSRKPSLLLLYCGGTIGMRQNIETSALEPGLTPQEILNFSSQLTKEFSYTTKTITNIDSTNMQPSHWEKLGETIFKDYANYDGFVIMHGTDTMAYTASALSFSLGNLGKPVVFTGSQVPPNILGGDAIGNIVNAFQVATMDLAEVVIVFGTKILRGSRAKKVSESERNAFLSPVFPELGSIRLQPELTYTDVKRRHNGSLNFQNGFQGNVVVVNSTPGLKAETMNILINSNIDGIILETFGPGNVPNQGESLIPSIKLAQKKKMPFVVSTQCIYGSTRMYLYESGQESTKYGAIPTGDMTAEAAYAKLKWLLHQTKDVQEITKMMSHSYAGEITIER